ncbi:MAG: hypothetical protein IK144_12075 [Bacteroidaceae bacterium]|nr:hypothetical protein [Bacteroidaceae bacterium]
MLAELPTVGLQASGTIGRSELNYLHCKETKRYRERDSDNMAGWLGYPQCDYLKDDGQELSRIMQ